MAAFGNMLREIRKAKRLSQLDLAVESEVSTRHISFLETGRAKPSREMILHLARQLDIPFKETNMLLAAAGFAHQYRESNIADPGLANIRNALNFMLQSNEPYPAIVLDAQWNILMANQAQQRIVQKLVALGAKFPPTFNIMEHFMAEEGYRQFVTNWDEVVVILLQRMHKEHLLSARRDEPNTQLEKLLTFPGVPTDWLSRDIGDKSHPLVEVRLEIEGQALGIFSTIATFGTPLDVTLQDIRIEHYFPADENTRLFFENLTH
ncbi:MAG: helix-turn-helix transcriptional regulator [Pseudomonadales bacterium]|uniref:Putative transcriptional regulator n=1 Tax=Oleiphilus messinensis TaxID=141451 RepID=A0A1Y0IJ01_9GAMM|nr:helix-turn-helix transcriptional regulator [Oleiphilus messinensis]ARU59374.1 putative transcriptional regulator [Oleiphilus messinensis]MCG8609368.1 helix-turn-helix transcriptional regulator [Pseudomonadales bacterium]